MEGTAIRVNGSQLASHTHARVCLVGRVVDVQDARALVDTCDGRRVTVFTHSRVEEDCAYFEFIGTVQGPDSIREEDRVMLGNTFDMESYNELVGLIHSGFPKLFHA